MHLHGLSRRQKTVSMLVALLFVGLFGFVQITAIAWTSNLVHDGRANARIIGDGLDTIRGLLNYYSKEICTCLFVVGQSESYCRESTHVDAFEPSVVIDSQSKMVRTHILRLFNSRSQYIDERNGCASVRK